MLSQSLLRGIFCYGGEGYYYDSNIICVIIAVIVVVLTLGMFFLSI